MVSLLPSCMPLSKSFYLSEHQCPHWDPRLLGSSSLSEDQNGPQFEESTWSLPEDSIEKGEHRMVSVSVLLEHHTLCGALGMHSGGFFIIILQGMAIWHYSYFHR